MQGTWITCKEHGLPASPLTQLTEGFRRGLYSCCGETICIGVTRPTFSSGDGLQKAFARHAAFYSPSKTW